MYKRYRKNAAVMSTVLAIVAVTGVMFIRETAYSSTRGTIEWVTLEQKMQNLDFSGIPVQTVSINYKTTGSPMSTQFRSVYVAVTENDKVEPTDWAEIQECRVWGNVDFWPISRCTVSNPTVTKPSTFWIRVTTNNPDGSPKCGYGVAPSPSDYCGDSETLSLPVTP